MWFVFGGRFGLLRADFFVPFAVVISRTSMSRSSMRRLMAFCSTSSTKTCKLLCGWAEGVHAAVR